ncbi:zinc finger CCCH domain-containing protein 56-like isoform X2 [Herrania umbratica]|uniref:Zinc finger CCCH domain-containing protein 56-like isoform X2 n=1 Tax=Herrania umbratica TaxID=108875 RepID=A0A6J1BGK7_9ROSI|nr:zinc finger CCCH domain-containing protein 56-like isoform X2 [Herrania umbratica]
MLSNYSMNISRDANKPMLQWQPQHPIQGKDHETSSLIEYPSFKKRRICENFVPNPSIPVAMKEVASGCFKARQCGPKWKEFADDSKKLCRMFCTGRNCSYGDRCRFLHVIPDEFRDISMINIVPGAAPVYQNRGSGELDCKGSVGSLNVGNEVVPKPTSWKTKLCNNWKMTGGCPYGKACCFAHGEAELQKLGGHFALES